jgi:hypothetical protein
MIVQIQELSLEVLPSLNHKWEGGSRGGLFMQPHETNLTSTQISSTKGTNINVVIKITCLSIVLSQSSQKRESLFFVR